MGALEILTIAGLVGSVIMSSWWPIILCVAIGFWIENNR